MFGLVQLGLREGVIEVVNGHLIEGDHVLKLIQLKTQEKEQDENQRPVCSLMNISLKSEWTNLATNAFDNLTSCSYWVMRAFDPST